MSRAAILAYGIFTYAVGMGGLVFFILFVGGWDFLPFHLDSGSPRPLWPALPINVSLMVMLGLQHSLMARRGFKKTWTKIIPTASERSTYVLMSGLAFIAICVFWQPIAGTVWHVDNQIARTVLTAISLSGWALVVAASFSINHFELFGLQQVYFCFVAKPEPAASFTDRNLYKIVRHPLQLGVLIGIWATATMTTTHLVLSSALTLYIFIGLSLEEKDLVATLGRDYQAYQERVPMILPCSKRSTASK
jgi:protein-S-isoprenylcysteine O-methyltransferase Ste14